MMFDEWQEKLYASFMHWWLLLTVVALAVLLLAESRDSALWKALSKPLASAGFIGLAVAAGALETSYGQAVLVALAFSWLGDVLLLSSEQRPFLLGLAAFLLGHVAYAVAFVVYGQNPGWSLGALAILCLPAFVVLRRLGPHLPAAMRLPVYAYVAVISVMVALAVGAFAAGAHQSLLVGAVAFYLSDLAVARDRFVAPGFVNRLVGLPLYYFAQVCLAWSVHAVSRGAALIEVAM